MATDWLWGDLVHLNLSMIQSHGTEAKLSKIQFLRKQNRANHPNFKKYPKKGKR